MNNEPKPEQSIEEQRAELLRRNNELDAGRDKANKAKQEAWRAERDANLAAQEAKPAIQDETTLVQGGESAAASEKILRKEGEDLRTPETIVIGTRTDYDTIK